MIAVVLSLIASTPVQAVCDAPTKAAIAYVNDSDPLAQSAVEAALSRGCFDVVEVKAGSDADMLKAAKMANAPWLLVARAGLVEALQDRLQGYLFSVDITALDADSGARRGRAMRQATILGNADRVPKSREAERILDDSVRVLRAQVTGPIPVVTVTEKKPEACAQTRDIVLLWNKNSDVAGRAAVLRALAARCVQAPDQFDSDRAGATEFARDLKRPLVAIKTTMTRPTGGLVTHVLGVTVDIVDANAAELKVLKHASDTRNALNAVDDVDAWGKVELSLVGLVLDQALADVVRATP